MKVYGITTCGSVKKARLFLDSHHIKYEFYDIKKALPSLEQIQLWAQKVGINILLNTKGTTYKTLGLGKLNLNDTEKVQKMAVFPLLIKRPVIEYNDDVIVGFSEKEYQDIFL